MVEKATKIWFNYRLVGVWLSLVERCVRDAEAGGSNPLTPTKTSLQASCPLERHGFVPPEAWYDQYRRIYRLFERTLKN
jgi:hypothetical protein